MFCVMLYSRITYIIAETCSFGYRISLGPRLFTFTEWVIMRQINLCFILYYVIGSYTIKFVISLKNNYEFHRECVSNYHLPNINCNFGKHSNFIE